MSPYPVAAARGKISGLVKYKNQDTFATPRAAGAVNGTAAEPGPGIRTVVDTNSLITVNATSQLQFGPGSPAANDRIYFPASVITRASGLACAIDWISGSISGADTMGWISTAGAGVAALSGGNYSDSNSDNVGVTFSAGMTGICILRANGAYYVVKNGSTYTLYWEDTDGGTGNAVVGVRCANVNHATLKLDNFRVFQLSDPWKTTYGIATTALTGARAVNDTFTHTADFLGDCITTTLPASGQIQIAFRMQDATNYWRIDLNSDGSGALQEVVSGTPTSRATCAAGSFASGSKMTFRAIGTSIVVARIGVQKMTYASATNFQTATAGKILSLGTGGAITGMFTYPRVLSGTALSTLSSAL